MLCTQLQTLYPFTSKSPQLPHAQQSHKLIVVHSSCIHEIKEQISRTVSRNYTGWNTIVSRSYLFAVGTIWMRVIVSGSRNEGNGCAPSFLPVLSMWEWLSWIETIGEIQQRNEGNGHHQSQISGFLYLWYCLRRIHRFVLEIALFLP